MVYKQEDRELLLSLLKMQEKSGPITLSIGYVTAENQVHTGILLHEAPPAVISSLVKDGYSCSLVSGGMHVYKL